MKVRTYLSGNPVHDRVLRAFHDGCPEKDKALVTGWDYQPSDIAVIFGVHKSQISLSFPRGKVFRQQRDKKLDVVVLETGYVNRGDGEHHHYAAGFNGLNGRADFRNKNMSPERWKKLGVQLKPYSRGEKVVLCGQVPWDASVDMHDHKKWLMATAHALKGMTTRPIVFRPHPLAALPPINGFEFSSGKPLTADLPDAHCVVTWNSNSAVEALIEGKPVFAADEGSMVWGLANKPITDIENVIYPKRDQWAANLAYAQWTPAEMREGMAWAHLLRS